MKTYTVKEISEEYKLTEVYLREEIRKGKLLASYFGRRAGYRVDETDLKAWLDAKKKHTGGK